MADAMRAMETNNRAIIERLEALEMEHAMYWVHVESVLSEPSKGAR